MPIVSGDRCDNLLVSGPFLRRRWSADDLRQSWFSLTGEKPRSTDAKGFAHTPWVFRGTLTPARRTHRGYRSTSGALQDTATRGPLSGLSIRWWVCIISLVVACLSLRDRHHARGAPVQEDLCVCYEQARSWALRCSSRAAVNASGGATETSRCASMVGTTQARGIRGHNAFSNGCFAELPRTELRQRPRERVRLRP